MFGGTGAGTLSEAAIEQASKAMAADSVADGDVLTPPDQMGIVPEQPAVLGLKPSTKSPIVSVASAAMKLGKELGVMRTELVKSVNESALKRKIEGFSFDSFDEKAVAARQIGVKLLDKDYEVGNPKREPYTKVITDLCRLYNLPDDVKQNMLNGELAHESHQVHFEFKFTKGKPGNFYFGKFMAINNNKVVDYVFLFYRLGFKISPDSIVHEHAHKFLWFTTHTTYTTEVKEVSLSEKDLTDFKSYFRLKMYKELGEQIKAFQVQDGDEL